MTPIIDRAQTEAFRSFIARRFGLFFDDARLEFVADALRQGMEAARSQSVEEYRARLVSPAGAAEHRALVERLTVGETFFFRNPDNFRAFEEEVLPDRLRARADSRRLRILSAGCATGEEPYTIAMILRRCLPEPGSWDIRILGVDLNPGSLARAAAGRYSEWSLRATPENARRYFSGSGRDLVLDPALRQMVTFEERNIAADDPAWWRSLGCDVIFCRNVLMYFTPEALKRSVDQLTMALQPGGYFFLGHAETLRGLTSDFHLCHTHDTFYYQRRREGEPVAADFLPTSGFQPTPEAWQAVDTSASWFDVIQQASARITSLTDRHAREATAPPSKAPAAVPSPRPSWDLGAVRELMKQERFEDALALLVALPADSLRDPDALLLRAILFANSGRREEAETISRRLLAMDELNAGAHYVLALCREHAADLSSALEHDARAAYLDGGFAMPHLHHGILAKRTGDLSTARRELALAQVLLAREDPARFLLFGGGFSREGLMNLCRAELSAMGGVE